MEEMKRAIELEKPRWFFVDDRVPFARSIQKSLEPPTARIQKSRVFDPLSIDAYNLATRNDVPEKSRSDKA